MRLVQFELSNGERRVGVVEDGLGITADRPQFRADIAVDLSLIHI